MEPHAYHKAEYWDEDDSTNTVVHSVSFRVEWRMDVFQDVKALKEHKVDSEAATIIGTATKIVKQVSNWRPAGITRFSLEPRAAVLTPNTAATTRTTRNTSSELSWDRAKPRSLVGGIGTYLVLKRLVIANDSKELIERIGHETVDENLNNDVMNNTNSEVNSEEPEFIWAALCQTMTQKSVRKTDTNRTDRAA